MPTLTITKTYDTGNVLTETDLDNIKDSIETFINVTKLNDDNLQDDGISITKLTPTARTYLVPTGVLLPYGGSSAPTGYLFPYGQEVSQATYAALYLIYGTSFNTGGEAVGNFRLPDLRGRAIFGKDNMGGSAANRITAAGSGITGTTLGASGGTETHTLITAELASHDHTFSGTTGTGSSHNHTVPVSANSGNANTAQQGDAVVSGNIATSSENSHNHSFSGTTATSGSGTAHQNTPPGIIMNIIVRT